MNIELNASDLEKVDEYNRAMKVALEAGCDDPQFTEAMKVLDESRRALSVVLVVKVGCERVQQAAIDAAVGKIKFNDAEDLVIMQVNGSDYPKFCDACWESGFHKILLRELTENELDGLGQNYPEELREAAMESLK